RVERGSWIENEFTLRSQFVCCSGIPDSLSHTPGGPLVMSLSGVLSMLGPDLQRVLFTTPEPCTAIAVPASGTVYCSADTGTFWVGATGTPIGGAGSQLWIGPGEQAIAVASSSFFAYRSSLTASWTQATPSAGIAELAGDAVDDLYALATPGL